FPSVAAVNETFARRYFGGQSVVGRTFEVMRPGGRKSVQIVSLVRDARYTNMRGPIPASVYVPFRTKENIDIAGKDSATFVVRTKDAHPASVAAVLRQEVPRARPEFLVANIRTQKELVRAQTVRERMLAMLSVFFATVA